MRANFALLDKSAVKMKNVLFPRSYRSANEMNCAWPIFLYGLLDSW